MPSINGKNYRTEVHAYHGSCYAVEMLSREVSRCLAAFWLNVFAFLSAWVRVRILWRALIPNFQRLTAVKVEATVRQDNTFLLLGIILRKLRSYISCLERDSRPSSVHGRTEMSIFPFPQRMWAIPSFPAQQQPKCGVTGTFFPSEARLLCSQDGKRFRSSVAQCLRLWGGKGEICALVSYSQVFLHGLLSPWFGVWLFSDCPV